MDKKDSKISSAGLVYLYLTGWIGEEEIFVQHVDSCTFPMDRFCGQADRIRSQLAEPADVELFCVLGVNEKIDAIAEVIKSEIRKSFSCAAKGKKFRSTGKKLDAAGKIFAGMVHDFIISENALRYPQSLRMNAGTWGVCCFWGGEDEYGAAGRWVEDAVETWLAYERPVLLGKQIALQSFLLRDLIGRRIVDVLPVSETGSLDLLLEGELKLQLNCELPYLREKFQMNGFSSANIDTILLDPVYAYGVRYEPVEICEEWHKVFLYTAALTEVEWDMDRLVPVYETFLHFLEYEICRQTFAERVVEKEVFLKRIILAVEKVRSFLRGEEEFVISRDLLMLMNSRYIYLPYVVELFHAEFPHMNIFDHEEEGFQAEILRSHIQLSETGDANEKGRRWEKAAEYVMAHVRGLAVCGRRVRAGTQEIDLSVANRSQDGELWMMGAYILVECKNWKRRAGVPVIRNLGHICSLKGNKTAILFAANGLTAAAQTEVSRLGQRGICVLCITRDEMLNLDSGQACRRLILTKWKECASGTE